MSERKTIPSYECMNACILNYFRQEGISISGSDIFFSGVGYPVHYQKGSLTRIKTEGYDSNFRFLKKYNVNYQFRKVKADKDTLIDLLQQPYTITIRMISDYLTYDRVFSQTSGASHFINIISYDRESRKFFIVDGDVPSMETGCFSGWVDEEDIVKGWQIMQGEVLQMDLSSVVSKVDLAQKARQDANENIRVAVENYLYAKQRLFSGEVFGEKAIITMVDQLGNYVERSEFREITGDANFRLRVNGYIGAKKFLLEKIKEQGKVNLAKEYQGIIDAWLRWCMLLLKCGMSSKQEHFILVKERMEEIVTKERNILEKLLLE